jgi:hypothetical protein
MTRFFFSLMLAACSSIDTTDEICNPFTQHKCADFHHDAGVRKGRCCHHDYVCSSELTINPYPGACIGPDPETE